MGKKESWFSAVKRVFIPSSKDKQANGSEKKSAKEKKKGRGIFRSGQTKSFIPLFREPSSIEKILGEADQQKFLIRPLTPSELPNTLPLLPARPASPKEPSPRAVSGKAASTGIPSPKAASSIVVHHQKEIDYVYRPEPTLRNHHLSAIKIQAAYRGFVARRSFRTLRGLVRLQGVVRSQNVKRQTMNALKRMQLLVRVQTHIYSRRIQMIESEAIQCQAYKNYTEEESTLSKWTVNQLSDAGRLEEWEDSLLTKEEIEEKLQRKMEATIKRERAMIYAYSHQLYKANPKSVQTSIPDIQSSGCPWWWNRLQLQLPPSNPPKSQPMKNVQLKPPRPTPEHKQSPWPQTSNYKQHNLGMDNLETITPRSSRSMVHMPTKHVHTCSNRTPPAKSSSLMKYSNPRAIAADSTSDFTMKDDDSLLSCPPFSVPNYMAPTISAKAKVRANRNPNGSFPGTPSSESKWRFPFPFPPNIGSFKWNQRSSKDYTSKRVLEKHQSLQSIGDLSVDSAVSMPAAVGRKPFNRFV